MANNKDEYLEYVLEQLELILEVKVGKMFGGFGLYSEGKIFALIVDNELYFKGDDAAGVFYESHGGEKFRYDRKDGKTVFVRYWTVPQEVMEETEKLRIWINYALY